MKHYQCEKINNRCYKRILAITVIITYLICSMSLSFAQDNNNFKNKETHRKLCEVVRFSGIPEYYAPSDQELSTPITREVGIGTVLRLLGMGSNGEISSEEVEQTLSKYTDANEISAWARSIIAFAIKNKIISGVSENKIGVKERFTGRMFSAIALKSIGYKLDSEEYECACAVLAEKGGLSIRQAVLLNDKKLIKDDLIGMSYSLLKAERADKKTVIESLVESGFADRESAKKYYLIK